MPQVGVLVANDFLEDLASALVVMKAREISRTPSDEYTTRVTVEMAFVPDGATLVEPIFMSTPDGVRVQSLSWTYS